MHEPLDVIASAQVEQGRGLSVGSDTTSRAAQMPTLRRTLGSPRNRSKQRRQSVEPASLKQRVEAVEGEERARRLSGSCWHACTPAPGARRGASRCRRGCTSTRHRLEGRRSRSSRSASSSPSSSELGADWRRRGSPACRRGSSRYTVARDTPASRATSSIVVLVDAPAGRRTPRSPATDRARRWTAADADRCLLGSDRSSVGRAGPPGDDCHRLVR